MPLALNTRDKFNIIFYSTLYTKTYKVEQKTFLMNELHNISQISQKVNTQAQNPTSKLSKNKKLAYYS